MANKNAYSRFYGGSIDNVVAYMVEELHGSAFFSRNHRLYGMSFKEGENKENLEIFIFTYDVAKNYIGKSKRFSGPKNAQTLKTILMNECNNIAT